MTRWAAPGPCLGGGPCGTSWEALWTEGIWLGDSVGKHLWHASGWWLPVPITQTFSRAPTVVVVSAWGLLGALPGPGDGMWDVLADHTTATSVLTCPSQSLPDSIVGSVLNMAP